MKPDCNVAIYQQAAVNSDILKMAKNFERKNALKNGTLPPPAPPKGPVHCFNFYREGKST